MRKKAVLLRKVKFLLIFIGHTERGGPIRSEIEIVQGINIEKKVKNVNIPDPDWDEFKFLIFTFWFFG